MTITAEEKQELRDLCEKAHVQRIELDQTLAEIEAIVGTDLDGLDEWVGNGIDADAVIEAAEKELAEYEGDDDDPAL